MQRQIWVLGFLLLAANAVTVAQAAAPAQAAASVSANAAPDLGTIVERMEAAVIRAGVTERILTAGHRNMEALTAAGHRLTVVVILAAPVACGNSAVPTSFDQGS